DLNPAGATASEAHAASSSQQAGYAVVGGQWHAGLWSGTADSWVDLNPAGATYSFATAASGSQQAGYAFFVGDMGGYDHAGLWSGTADSWIDLHALLPAGFLDSHAQGISTDGINIYVSGYGLNTLTHRYEALLWTRPLCPGDFNHDGFVDGNDYNAFAELFEMADPGADFNANGFVNGDDYDAFAEHFEIGC
ncbi:MAG: hypothetical protein IT434_11250, partial [Phycisphaerales bacterium]|nr:hypothetical protein [Phycisphaerales bacterium]